MSDFGGLKHPTAAKDHRCQWCGHAISTGEKHAHYVGKWEGEFQHWRMHAECYEAFDDTGDESFMPFEGERPKVSSHER